MTSLNRSDLKSDLLLMMQPGTLPSVPCLKLEQYFHGSQGVQAIEVLLYLTR